MAHRKLLFPLLLLCLALASGCGDDTASSSGTGTGTDAGTGDAGNSADLAATADEGPVSGYAAEPPATYSNSCPESEACETGRTCVDTLCVRTPPADLVLGSPLTDLVSEEAMDLSCLDGSFGAPEGPATARMWGLVDRFGGGNKTIGIEVQVYRASEFQPWTCPSEDVEARDACFGDHATALGTTVSIDPDDYAPNAAKVANLENILCQDHSDCPLGYECIDPNGTFRCFKQFGLFAIDGLPTNETLVVRTRPTRPTLGMRAAWLHDVVLLADRAAADPEGVEGVRFDPTIISESQWVQVPNTFGRSVRIQEGNTAIGGRIRDCHGGGRSPDVSFYLGGVTIASGQTAAKIGYFNDKEDDALPLVNQTSTNILGRYAIVDVGSGWNKVVGAATVNGEVTSLGSREVFLLPDVLNIVSFPGRVTWYEGFEE